jgi:hypothetical protein
MAKYNNFLIESSEIMFYYGFVHLVLFSLTVAPQMYVPGRIANGKSVILDIGTGYYVQKVSHIQR